jgi:hypothetical protein
MPLQLKKLFLEPRTWIGNTGFFPLQPIDQAAWIWHPDAGPGLQSGTGGAGRLPVRAVARTQTGKLPGRCSGARDEAPVFLRFRRDFAASSGPRRREALRRPDRAADGAPLVIHVSAEETADDVEGATQDVYSSAHGA